MQLFITSVLVLAVVGLLIGLFLVFANKKFAVQVDPKEEQIRACLPGNNCGACGFAGCDAMAEAMAKGEAKPNGCPVGGAACAEKVAEILGVNAEDTEKLVAYVKCSGTFDVIKPHSNYVGIETCEAAAALPGKGMKSCQYGCLGYGSCVKVCQFDAIHVINGVARVDRTKCASCGMCVNACPQHIIELIPDKSVYAVTCSNLERGPIVKKQCDAGCIGCMLCTRQCEFDAIHVKNNVATIDYSKCTGCGKCAEKCPAKIIRMR